MNWNDLKEKLINSQWYYFHTENGVLLCGDCLKVMKEFPEKIFDAIITDPPYGTTACKWDVVIPFEDMWKELKRIRKDRTPIVLFGSEPFSSLLRVSNLKEYKYDWIWNKKIPANPFLAKYQPLRIYENIMVFYKHNYYPIKEKRKKARKYKDKYGGGEAFNKKGTGEKEHILEYKYPVNIIEISNAKRKGIQHPTQKPLTLMEYLVKTYTNERDLVLDFTCGSGTTLVACERINRRWIGIEINPEYCEIAKQRIIKCLREKECLK